MSKYVKDLITKEIAQQLEGVNDALLVSVIGLDVNKTVLLRKQLREQDIRLLVVKNSLVKRATEGTPLAAALDGVEGTLAVVWGGEDIVSLTKVVTKLHDDKEYEAFQTRGGVIQEHWGVDQLTQLSGSGSTLGFGLPLLRDDPALPYSAARGIWELQAGFVRHETIAGEDFHRLIQMFLNSGSQYNPQTGQPDTWQELLLWFMGDAYLGYFTSLDWSEEADQPFRWLYSFAFTVTFAFLNRPMAADTRPRPVSGFPGQSRRPLEQQSTQTGAFSESPIPFFEMSDGSTILPFSSADQRPGGIGFGGGG